MINIVNSKLIIYYNIIYFKIIENIKIDKINYYALLISVKMLTKNGSEEDSMTYL